MTDERRALEGRVEKAPWNAAYVEERAAFPNGANDDQVDGSSGAFAKLARRGAADGGPGPAVVQPRMPGPPRGYY
jgi:hypothetical protein